MVGIFDRLKRKSKFKAVFCGLDNSGKSTIISFLQEGRFVQQTPTMGKKKQELDVEGTRITIIDMGGQEDFRKLWLGELKGARVVVFVVDKADITRFQEAKLELDKLLPEIKKNGITLLILANKHDLSNAASLGTIFDAFQLGEVEEFEILEISAKTGYGLADAFAKFYSLMTGEILKKSIMAKQISIFDNSGVPLVTQSGTNEESDKLTLEGGFLAAISQFSEHKIEGTNVIKFQSPEKGTYLVVRSPSFIGSLLWTKDVEVSLDQSEDALRSLLEHLETIIKSGNVDDIKAIVEHYSTNLM